MPEENTEAYWQRDKLIIKIKINKNQLKIKIHFSHQIDNHEEYRIVTLCGIAGYFVEKDKLSLKIKYNSLFVGDIETQNEF